MPDNRTFQFAVLISVLVHFVLILNLPHIPFLPSKRSLKNLKITYYKIEKPPEKKQIVSKKKEPVLKKLPEIKKEEVIKPPKTVAKKTKEINKKIERLTTVEVEREKRFEVIVEEEEDEAKKVTYISYYRAVREKIKRYADSNYLRNMTPAEGEILLSFIVASSGELLQVKVINERSTNNALLKDIGIGSIKEASPFPPFPEGMSQYQITFNVIISFELNK